LREDVDLENIDLTRDMFVYPLIVYAVWWALYAIWIFTIGNKLPDRGWGKSSFSDSAKVIESKFNLKNRYG
jgi:hypothetical protein